MRKLNNINELADLINGLALNKVQATKLNRTAGNAMRRVVRANLKAQKDIHGKSFEPRKKLKYTKSFSGKISLNKNMLRTASRSLNQFADEKGVALGYSTVASKILKTHNWGANVKFKRSSGKYVSYLMPKREFFGWSDAMIAEVRNSIINEYSKLKGAH